jgi:hypothetical protein
MRRSSARRRDQEREAAAVRRPGATASASAARRAEEAPLTLRRGADVWQCDNMEDEAAALYRVYVGDRTEMLLPLPDWPNLAEGLRRRWLAVAAAARSRQLAYPPQLDGLGIVAAAAPPGHVRIEQTTGGRLLVATLSLPDLAPT